MTSSEEVLRRLTIGDPVYYRTLFSAEVDESPSHLDARSAALLRLGALIASGTAGPTWQQIVGEARNAGLSFDDVVDSLLVLAPTVGLDRIVSGAPQLARALGYDVDAALYGWPDDSARQIDT